MKSRYLCDLTTPEVQGYLEKGGDLAILPLGAVEMHGPHQPLGTDVIIARAFSLRLAEAADGIVLPDFPYTWAGATDGFVGTISVEPELFRKYVEAIAIKVLKMGFKRLVLASFHGPNPHILWATARRMFERHAPVFLIDIGKHFSQEARDIFPSEREASLLLAAYEILGITDLYTEKDLSYVDTAPPFSQYLEKLSKVGTVGMFYQDMRHHACPHTNVSREKGLRFIDVQVAALIPVLKDLGLYIEEVKNQKNQGWSR